MPLFLENRRADTPVSLFFLLRGSRSSCADAPTGECGSPRFCWVATPAHTYLGWKGQRLGHASSVLNSLYLLVMLLRPSVSGVWVPTRLEKLLALSEGLARQVLGSGAIPVPGSQDPTSRRS